MVDFIFLGPSKTGSDYIYQLLKGTQKFDMCKGKGTFYFTDFYKRGPRWYESHFESNAKLKAEVCHDYFHDKRAIHRIFKYNPNAKLIVCLRNPFHRIVSSIEYYRKNGYTEDILELIRKYPSIVEESCYASNMRRIVDVFGNDNVLVLDFDKISETDELLTRIFSYLDVSINRSEFKKMGGSAQRNARMLPRSKLLTRFVKQCAVFARRIGLGPIVYRIHKSELVSRTLYIPGTTIDYDDYVRVNISRSIINTINQEVIQLRREFGLGMESWIID